MAENAKNTEILPKGWIKSISKKYNLPYYYHEVTKRSIWIHPSLLNPESNESTDKDQSHMKKESNSCFPISKRKQSSRFPEIDVFSKKSRKICSTTIDILRSKSNRSPVSISERNIAVERLKTPLATDVDSKYVENCKHRVAIKNRLSSTSEHDSLSFNTKKLPSDDTESLFKTVKDGTTNSKKTPAEFGRLKSYSAGTKLHMEDPLFGKAEYSISNSLDGKLTAVDRSKLKPLVPNKLNYHVSIKSDHQKRLNAINNIADCGKTGSHYQRTNNLKSTPTDLYLKCNPAMKAVIEKQKIKILGIKAFKGERERGKGIKSKEHTKKEKKRKAKLGIKTAEDDHLTAFKPLNPSINTCSKNNLTVINNDKEEKSIKNSSEKYISEDKDIENPSSSKVSQRHDLFIRSNNCLINSKEKKKHVCFENAVSDKEKQCLDLKIASSSSCGDSSFFPFNLGKEDLSKSSSFANAEDRNIPAKVRDKSNTFSESTLTSLDEQEDMEVDDATILSEEIVEEIRELRKENLNEKPKLSVVESQILPQPSGKLYIILDTNVLLAHLKFVSELKDYHMEGFGAPILVVPWMVLQELDSLKKAIDRYHITVNKDGNEEKSQKVSTLATQAIRFIGNCLDKSHPRLKGESPMEAGTPIPGFTEESNDDSIIHCGLGLKMRTLDGYIVFFSNDRNLCNKAFVAGFKAFNYENLISSLNDLCQKKGNVRNAKPENEDLELDKNFIDLISCELQSILLKTWSIIIEKEMISAYGGDLWKQIVVIQPPWILQDIFILFEKHWIAVFGHLVDRKLRIDLKDLKDKFKFGSGSFLEFESIKEIFQLSLKISNSFAIHSSYEGMLKEGISELKTLLKKMDNLHLADSTQVLKNVVSLKGHHNPFYEKVKMLLDNLWNAALRFSAMIFHGLNFPNPLNEYFDPEEVPSMQESLSCLFIMTPCILNLIKNIHNIVESPLEDLSETAPILAHLSKAINKFTRDVMKESIVVDSNDLFEFCKYVNTRNVLVQGLSQLDRLYAVLQQCLEYQRSSSLVD